MFKLFVELPVNMRITLKTVRLYFTEIKVYTSAHICDVLYSSSSAVALGIVISRHENEGGSCCGQGFVNKVDAIMKAIKTTPV